jgi:hypothetical protein
MRLYIAPMQNIYLEGIEERVSASGSSAGEDPTYQMFEKAFGIKY